MRFLRRAEPPRDEDAETLLIEDGRVSCPREGDTDIEQCYVCGWMAGSDLGGEHPTVRCVAHQRDQGVASRLAHIF